MPNIASSANGLRALESLAAGRTVIHRLHPAAKLFCALAFIVFTASFGRYDFTRLAPYLFYPFLMMALAEIPYGILLKRVLIALPFCLFAGLSNVVIDRETALSIGGAAVSFGVLSLMTILLKMYLCVMAALLLAATTPFAELTAQLRRLHIPAPFVTVFEITYRYIGVLLEELRSMTTAYRLRSGDRKALDVRHMGSFTGGLLLRGFDRAERVHAAMCCRGYSLRRVPPARRGFAPRDAAAAALVCVPAAALRLFPLW
ncbi:MAG: cobalt ECF transporter T component CbiQ [Oscillospiraceae bacterium]|jgi:cobalt/nickel transport system permease protein|nr:cobalt ECF transporter T component CbiQ [Oscillospiraceae bacterium]